MGKRLLDKHSGFKNQAELRHIGGKYFELLADLTFYSEKYHREFTAPAGIITDLASIPAFAQSFCQVLGNNLRSAILHDFHCTKAGKIANKVSQYDTDAIFNEGLCVDEVRWSKSRLMFGMVSGFQRTKYFFKWGETYR